MRAGGSTVLQPMSFGELTAAISGLCGLAVALMRTWGWVALVREQRQAMAVVIGAVTGNGQSVSPNQQVAGAHWSVDIVTDHSVLVDRSMGSKRAADNEEVQ
jgi:hypothetical protein